MHLEIVVDERYRAVAVIALHRLDHPGTGFTSAIDNDIFPSRRAPHQEVLCYIPAADKIKATKRGIDNSKAKRCISQADEPADGREHNCRNNGDLCTGQKQAHAEVANYGVIETEVARDEVRNEHRPECEQEEIEARQGPNKVNPGNAKHAAIHADCIGEQHEELFGTARQSYKSATPGSVGNRLPMPVDWGNPSFTKLSIRGGNLPHWHGRTLTISEQLLRCALHDGR